MTSDENQFCTEVRRRVVANERNGSGGFADENREPAFGIEKADVEGDIEWPFPGPSSWRSNSLEVSGC